MHQFVLQAECDLLAATRRILWWSLALASSGRKIQFCPLLYDGWWKSNHTQRWWHSLRNLQSHTEEDPCHQIVKTYWSFGKLRPTPQRVFLRSASRRLLAGSQLLSNGKVALSNPCLRSTLWRGARVLGVRFQSGRALLLDDLYNPQRHSGKPKYLRTETFSSTNEKARVE